MKASVAFVLAAAATACGSSSPVGPTGSTSASVSTPSPPPGATGGTTGLTYVKDIQAILSSDCVTCHSSGRASAGVDLSSYAGVMRVVTPGNARSILIQVTQVGGLMYSQLSGNRAQKAQTIYDWIVTDNAVQQ